MNEILFDVLIFVVIVAITLITRYAVPWLRAQVHESQYEEIVDVIAQAVRTAEQIIHGGAGVDKKEYVLALVNDWVTRNHIKITAEQINALIEAAVYALKQE